MSSNPQNPLNMVTDSFAGDTFELPQTECTEERRCFFTRYNEIIAFLYISVEALNKYKIDFETNIVPKLPTKENNPIRFSLNSGECITTTPKRIVATAESGVGILTRQLFVMCYGSFETYLFQLFERSFPAIGITNMEEIFDKSKRILMFKEWNGKFCTMNDFLHIGYKESDLTSCFSNFSLDFEGKEYNNPLDFLNELAQVRHRIVHASSILENNRKISIDMNVFNGFLGFFFLLTDYVDSLFAKEFSYDRKKINPREA